MRVIACAVLDFDGTVVLSNEIKLQGFHLIAAGFPDGRARMQAILDTVEGDRYAILARFAADVGAPSDAGALADRYTRWCQDRLTVCPERPGASELIEYLGGKGIATYLNSSTPAEALQRIIRSRYPAKTFSGVFGGFGNKVRNLEAIRAAESSQASEMVMIGDGVDDYEAAAEFGCHFIGVDGGTLARCARHSPLVNDLREAIPHFETAGDRAPRLSPLTDQLS